MSLAHPEAACLCRCCCLSDDPADSGDTQIEGLGGYNRRYDCSCRDRWVSSAQRYEPVALEVLRMRARDVGNVKVAARLSVIMGEIEVLRTELDKDGKS